jgi:hypothetical protein
MPSNDNQSGETILPGGVDIQVPDLTVARAVGTLVLNADGNVYRSTNATVAAYAQITDTASSLTLPEVADPGTGNAITVAGSAKIFFDVAATGETNSLSDPTADGWYLLLGFDNENAGTDTRIVTADNLINSNGNTIMTFNTPSETILLRSTEIRQNGVTVYRWLVDINFGVVLT